MTQRTIVILSFSLFVCALLWGGFSLIVYLGIPIHQLVYSTPDDVHTWDLACGTSSTSSVFFCRGAAVLIPFLIATFNMASPFFSYVIVSALALAALLLYQGYKTGYFSFKTEWRALSLVFMFVASVWLLATTFSLGTVYNWNTPDNARLTNVDGTKILPPFGRFFEPTAQVYQGAGGQALDALHANYQNLLSRGCLTETGIMTQNGAKLYDLGFWCMQESMFGRIGIQIAMVALFLFDLLILGSFLLTTVMRLKVSRVSVLMLLSIGTGALAWVAVIWSLAIASQLHSTVVRILFFGMPLLLLPQSIKWLKAAWEQKFDVDFSFKNWHLYLAWLLVTYIALNFFNVVRPFPIGWDDLGSYLNRPRLLASYGSFIPSMGQFQWEYITSLGFLLFGYDSWTGSTLAMEINWSAGLIAVLSVYLIGRLYFGKKGGVISAMMYYFLPMTGHFSFADMKIDNASFFTTALGVLALMSYLFPPSTVTEEGDDTHPDRKLLIVAGLLAGFSFAIKPTAILGILMMLTILTGSEFGAWGCAGAVFLSFALLQKFGAINVVDVSDRAQLGFMLSKVVTFVITLLPGLACLGYAFWRRRAAVMPYLEYIGLLAIGLAVATVPWMTYNVLHADYVNTSTILTAQDTTAPQVYYEEKDARGTLALHPDQPVRWLPDNLKLDPKNPACESSARTEELDRYWGFDKGISHYLALPWREVMNLDTFGYYVTFAPVLLLFPLLLLLPYFWTARARWLRLLFVATFAFVVQWTLVANGIAWYGIGMFLGIAVTMEAFIAKAPDSPNRWLMSFLIAMSIVICLANRFWQFDTQKNIFEYPIGKITAEALREVTIPDYDDIRESVVSRHETLTNTPYTYRIGTFISYFIPRNREIFPLADHQLNFFSCLNQEQNHKLTLKRLHALGFNSIIFDTNTQTIEKNPNGSLHQKVQKFLDFANDPAVHLNIAINDPGNGIAYIMLPTDSGSTVPTK